MKEAELKLGNTNHLGQENTAEIEIPNGFDKRILSLCPCRSQIRQSSEYCYSQSIKAALKINSIKKCNTGGGAITTDISFYPTNENMIVPIKRTLITIGLMLAVTLPAFSLSGNPVLPVSIRS